MADVTRLKNRARREEQRENWDAAIDLYRRALLESLDRSDSAADLSLFNRIGDIQRRTGDLTAAVETYEQAVSAYAARELHTSAIALCNKILRVMPDRVEAYRSLGRLRLATGLLAQARADYRRFAAAMRDRGEPSRAAEALEELLMRTRDPEVAGELLETLREAEGPEAASERMERIAKALEERGADAAPVRRATASVSEAASTPPRPDVPGGSADAPPRDDPGAEPEPSLEAMAALEAELDAAVGTDDAERAARGLRSPPREGGRAPDGRGEVDERAGAPEPRPGRTEPDAHPLPPPSPERPEPLPARLREGAARRNAPPPAASPLEGEVRPVARSTPPRREEAGAALAGAGDLRRRPDRDGPEGPEGVSARPSAAFRPPRRRPLPPARDRAERRSGRSGRPPSPETPAADRPELGRRGGCVRLHVEAVRMWTPRRDAAERASGPRRAPSSLRRWSPPGVEEAEIRIPAGVSGIAGEAPAWSDRDPEEGYRVPRRPGAASIPVGRSGEESDSLPPHGGGGFLRPPRAEREEGRAAGKRPSSPGGPAREASEGDLEPPREIALPVPAAERGPENAPRSGEGSGIGPLDDAGGANGGDPSDAGFAAWLAAANPEVLERSLDELARRGEVERALEVVGALLEHRPGDLELHRRRVAWAQDVLDPAVEERACADLAAALAEAGREEEAREVCRELIRRLGPDDARVQSVLEHIDRMEETGPSRERVDGERVLAPPPEDPPAGTEDAGDGAAGPVLAPYEYRGSGRSAGGAGGPDFDVILSELKEQLAERGVDTDTRSRTELGERLIEMGLLDEAIRELQAAIRVPGAPPRAYELLGEAFIEKGQPRVAARLLSDVVDETSRTDRELLGILYQLGVAYQEVEDRPGALECFERIFSIDIDYRDVQERIASCA